MRSFMVILLALASTVLAQQQHVYNETVGTFLKKSHYVQDFGALVETAGLLDQLNGPGPFTVFSPSRQAINLAQHHNVTIDSTTIQYHMVNGAYKLDDLDVNEKVLMSLNNLGIRLNHYVYTGHYTAQGSQLYITNRILNNGVVHVVHDIMKPASSSILDLVINYLQSNQMDNMIPILQSTGVADILNDGPITFFAPNQDAFNNTDNSTMQTLMANPDLFGQVLKYHIVPGTLYSSGIHTEDLPTFEEKDKIHLHRLFFDVNYGVDNGRMIERDVSATNGVIHVIDHLLIPQSLSAQITGSAS